MALEVHEEWRKDGVCYRVRGRAEPLSVAPVLCICSGEVWRWHEGMFRRGWRRERPAQKRHLRRLIFAGEYELWEAGLYRLWPVGRKRSPFLLLVFETGQCAVIPENSLGPWTEGILWEQALLELAGALIGKQVVDVAEELRERVLAQERARRRARQKTANKKANEPRETAKQRKTSRAESAKSKKRGAKNEQCEGKEKTGWLERLRALGGAR